MVSRKRFFIAAAVGFWLPVFGQTALNVAPIPSDPLELATGPIQVADSPESREAAVELLTRARSGYALRGAKQGYDIKVSFTVDSGGETAYDGAWEMEEIFDPVQGSRWTAKGAAGYSTTQIFSNKAFYGEGTGGAIPLRLHEARAALFGPMGSFDQPSIRTSTAIFNGAQVTCILLSGAGNAPNATPGRRWEETEECIDPRSGLLQMHSQVPGRYYAYDYSEARQLGAHVLPRRITVTEGGRVVSAISVDSLTFLPGAEPSLFVPGAEMAAKGPAIAMAGAQKIFRMMQRGPFPPGATVHSVCVFGLVTPSGQLVEAHSLQPSDPNSQAAVEAAQQMNFSQPAPAGTRPQQHFVFVVEKFVQ